MMARPVLAPKVLARACAPTQQINQGKTPATPTKRSSCVASMAQADKVTQLIRRYDLDRSVATQIAAGSADLEHVLRKRRQDAHLAEFKDRSVLVDAAASVRPARSSMICA